MTKTYCDACGAEVRTHASTYSMRLERREWKDDEHINHKELFHIHCVCEGCSVSLSELLFETAKTWKGTRKS